MDSAYLSQGMGYLLRLFGNSGRANRIQHHYYVGWVRIESRLSGKGKLTKQRLGAPEKKRAQEKSEKL
jgi:hypothetical protein